MTSSITTADIESLSGRPRAFLELVRAAFPDHLDDRWAISTPFGITHLDSTTGTIWWVYPWAPDTEREPWSRLDSDENGILHEWVERIDPSQETRLRIIVPCMPEDSAGWARRLGAELRSRTGRQTLRVDVDGPAELRRWLEEFGAAREVDHLFRARWGLHARAWDYSSCELALVAALDRGEAATEHWLVVADELQRRGDPTGESLALALSTAPDRPSQARVLSRAYVDREAARMAAAPRHMRMLAFADTHGRSFDADAFIPSGDELPEPDRYEVQLWVERVGPFFVRLLARTNYDPWRGVGLPEAVLDAPELRYLSPLRLSSIHPNFADLSGRDLSRFDFSALPRVVDVDSHLFAFGASLRGCNLCGADLSGWVLEGADLRDATADLRTRFGGANFRHARVSPSLHARLQSWNASPRRHRRRNADIRGVEMD